MIELCGSGGDWVTWPAARAAPPLSGLAAVSGRVCCICARAHGTSTRSASSAWAAAKEKRGLVPGVETMTSLMQRSLGQTFGRLQLRKPVTGSEHGAARKGWGGKRRDHCSASSSLALPDTRTWQLGQSHFALAGLVQEVLPRADSCICCWSSRICDSQAADCCCAFDRIAGTTTLQKMTAVAAAPAKKLITTCFISANSRLSFGSLNATGHVREYGVRVGRPGESSQRLRSG